MKLKFTILLYYKANKFLNISQFEFTTSSTFDLDPNLKKQPLSFIDHFVILSTKFFLISNGK